MESAVFVRRFSAPQINVPEVLRYAMAATPTREISDLLKDVRLEAEDCFSCWVCWREIPLPETPQAAIPGFSPEDSALLRENLPDCEAVVVFAATVGMGIDRLIRRYSHLSPARALMLQALGAERIESLCDSFCEEIRQQSAKQGMHTLPRFSPGYGTVPLSLQRDIFRLLDCSRHIGLTLNDSLLMTPTKSVTAFIGIRSCEGSVPSGGCSNCGKPDCHFRRTV